MKNKLIDGIYKIKKEKKFWFDKFDVPHDISLMSNEYLINAINFVNKRAEEGVMIGGGHDLDDMWCETVYGNEVKDMYDGYWDLIKEAKFRGIEDISIK